VVFQRAAGGFGGDEHAALKITPEKLAMILVLACVGTVGTASFHQSYR
jgi:hypothetical protein